MSVALPPAASRGSPSKLSLLARCRDDFPYHAATCLKIRDKEGKIVALNLNKVQLELHRRLEQQRDEKGWVRALVLKGRQPGISTYVAGRYYNRASLRRGVNVYILAHEQPASDNLFGIVDRYQRNNPLSPHVGVSNAKELIFDQLDSSYVVATAGTKAGGRSRSVSLFHGSEVAFWQNAKDHFSASVQGVPLLPGTEVILESTSAGAGGEFYERWQDAESNRGDYIAVFLPWFLSDTAEYQRAPEAGFALSQDADDGELSEQEYADVYGVSLPKMCWRRSKIIELRDASLFRREYPASPSDAWTSPPGNEPFIDPMTVLRARKRTLTPAGPLILGVDPASMGGDRFSVAARRGNVVLWVRYRNKIDHNEGTAWLKYLIDDLRPARVNIDAGNIGSAIVTNLKGISPSYAMLVRGVNFGGTSEFKLARPKVPGPANRRAEMWSRCRDWLLLDEGVALPDEDAIQTDLTAPRLKAKINHDFLLESKDEMRRRGIRSPDLADAICLTFAFKEFIKDYQDAPQVNTFGNPDPVSSDGDYAPEYGGTELMEGGNSNSWMGY